MKDLRDYYKSPPKPNIVIKDEVSGNSDTSAQDENAKQIAERENETTATASENLIGPSNVEKSTNLVSTQEEGTSGSQVDKKPQATEKDEKENANKLVSSKHRKKRGRKSNASRKHSDPAVKSITELLNASLNIISPNSSINASQRDSSSIGDVKGSSRSIEKTKSPRPSSAKKKPRRSSSDFETPNSLKKRKPDESKSRKSQINNDPNKTENSDMNTECGKKAHLPSSHFETPNSVRKTKHERSVAHKTRIGREKDPIKSVSRNNGCSGYESPIKCEDSQSSPTPPSSDKKKQKVNSSKNERGLGKNKKINDSARSDSPKAANNTHKKRDDEIITINSEEEVAPTDNTNSVIPEGTQKPKMNAFQFMMESRFKSIGQNLTGKETSGHENSEDEAEKKQKRLSRKSMLENWVESKADVKRKRKEEEEKDVYINYQLEKRAKRLKKLLNSNDDSKENVRTNAEEEQATRRKSLRKRVMKPVINTDSENSHDSLETKESKISSDDKNKVAVSVNNSLKEKGNSDTKNTNKGTAHIEKGLLNFLGIADKLKGQDDKKQDEESARNKTLEDGNSKEPKSKKTSKKQKSKLGLIKAELAHEEDANLELPNIHLAVSHIETEKATNQNSVDDSSLNSNTVEHHSSVDNCERSCSQDSIGSMQRGFQTPKNKKHKKRETIEDHLLGRSPRSWKMRIRLTSDDEGASTNDSVINKPSEKFIQEKDKQLETKNQSVEDQHERHERPRRKVRDSQADSSVKVRKIILSSDSDGEVEIVSPRKKLGNSRNMKIAPVFLKAAPKPKIDPKVAEARREFLMSGVPDQLKKEIERQISVEDIEFDVFPAISHIQQRSPTNTYWNIPQPDLKLAPLSPLKSDSENLIYSELTLKHFNETILFHEMVQKVEVCKQFIEQIKSQNSSYPVYKCFKSIYEKSGQKNTKNLEAKKTPKKKRGRKKKENHDDSVEVIEIPKERFDSSDHAMWTEKYKPMSSSEIIGNSIGVTQLKKWLERWLEPIDENVNKKKRRRNASTSESEFEYTDGDSRDSTSDSKNTVILKGPNGSGKTSAVYATCNELRMNVLELNASSKRTGKRLLQELQEATQSHQVMKGESATLSQFIKIEKQKEKSQSDGNHNKRKKICVLLVEDIDIIFEQDEGFLSALTQLIATSKRPIILSTTDETSQIIRRFTAQHPVIDFKPLSPHSLAVWLQILCLVEGVCVDVHSIGHLLEKNNGDVRRTMLELQYWVQSGGSFRQDKGKSILSALNCESKRCSFDDKFCDDDNSNMSFVNENNDNAQGTFECHADCLESFEVTSHGKLFNIPYRMSLSKLWWNLPQILSLGSRDSGPTQKNRPNTDVKLNETPKDSDVREATVEDKRIKRLNDRRKLDSMCEIYNCLILTDLMKGRKDCLVDLEPCPRQWDNALKDSLELKENIDDYSSGLDLTEDICHTLTDGCIHMYKNLSEYSHSINLGLPSIKDKRWREKQHLCEDILQDALSSSSYVDRRAVSLDFMPVLRQIGQSEMVRASHNVKRGNRFNHYLRGLGIDGGDSSYKIVCNVLNVNKFKSSLS